MPRIFGKPNIKQRQMLPRPEGVTTVVCIRCHTDKAWEEYSFRNSKERPGQLYRSGVCNECTVQMGRMRAARSFVNHHAEPSDLEMGLFLIDRAMCGHQYLD